MKTVLVVDDDPDILDVVVDLLSGEGYRVLSASNGVDALKALHNEQPCLILLDMRMPHMDGWAFASELKARGLSFPIMVMSAAQDAVSWRDEIGAHAVLPKPFGVDGLLGAVQSVCSPQ